MPIAPTLQNYLARKHVEYELVAHTATAASMPTAAACHIAPDALAKAVVLRIRNGYVLAVMPASCRIRHAELKETLGEEFALATEQELDQLFADCARGAIPAIGECYGLDVVIEDSIREQPGVYFEGGDHSTVVHVSQAQFARLTANAPHGHFAIRD